MITFCYKYAYRYISLSLSSAEASFCRREAGEREKRKAPGWWWDGEAFLSSHRPPRAYYSFYWDTHVSLYGGESQYMEQYDTDKIELPYN